VKKFDGTVEKRIDKRNKKNENKTELRTESGCRRSVMNVGSAVNWSREVKMPSERREACIVKCMELQAASAGRQCNVEKLGEVR
jgi:hypothetical protein